MNLMHFARRATFAAGLMALSLSAAAQTPPSAGQFEPQVGQPGKDVVWVPTPQLLVDRMLDMAKLTPQDYMMDLGSGDGRTVITAAKRGAKAHGIEYNADMVELSKKNAIAEGVTERATFAKADIFESDLSQATVITLFLLPDLNLRLRPTILDLKPGTRIVSNSFTMGDWAADETHTISSGCVNWCTALLWIVPAKVAGVWRSGQTDFILSQNYQTLFGSVTSGANSSPISEGRLSADMISFTSGGTTYTGKVNGNVIEGTMKNGNNTTPWRATKQP